VRGSETIFGGGVAFYPFSATGFSVKAPPLTLLFTAFDSIDG
jgi:hypothetical protein